MIKKHLIYLALGSNMGDKEKNINKALELLKAKVDVIKLAKMYETKPWGYADQENFLNTALRGKTNLTPQELLIFLKQIERQLGRVKRIKNGPREIDVDILYYDDLVINTADLVIPHPRIQEREFVLKPLADL
jgi:2-amino-4-hydroxy-6-hydroxymethyldihydropteridine diphosphokinase